MKRIPTSVLLVALVSGLAWGKGVQVEFDTEVDFSKYESFAWLKTPTTSLDEDKPLLHSGIVNAVEYYLTEAGLREDTENPELHVTYHARKQSSLRMDTTQLGYEPSWGNDAFWHAWTGTAHLRSFRHGTFVLDIIDVAEERLIWRGSAEGKLKENDEQVSRQLQLAISRMVRKFDKQNRKARRAD